MMTLGFFPIMWNPSCFQPKILSSQMIQCDSVSGFHFTLSVYQAFNMGLKIKYDYRISGQLFSSRSSWTHQRKRLHNWMGWDCWSYGRKNAPGKKLFVASYPGRFVAPVPQDSSAALAPEWVPCPAQPEVAMESDRFDTSLLRLG